MIFGIQGGGRIFVERVFGWVEMVQGGYYEHRIPLIFSKTGIEAHAQDTIPVKDIGGDQGLSVREGGIVGGPVILAIGSDFGQIDCFTYYSSHESQGEVHGFVVT